MRGDETVQEIKPKQSSRCDLYDVIIQDAYIDMNWTGNLNDKLIEGRDYSLKETADTPSLHSRQVPVHGTEDGSEDGSEDALDDEVVDDPEDGPGDDMEDGLSNDSGSGPKEDSYISFGYVLIALIVT